MNKRWKRALIWTSVGSVVAGAAVAVARRSSRTPAPPLVSRRIPLCTRITVWTRHFERPEDGRQHRVRDRYVLQATGFKVWTLLEPPADASGTATPGYTVYHVTLERASSGSDGEGLPEQSSVVERFCATVGATDGARVFRREVIVRGGYLRLNVCRVGGAAHGVETGEAHDSFAPVLNFRFEYGESAPAEADQEDVDV